MTGENGIGGNDSCVGGGGGGGSSGGGSGVVVVGWLVVGIGRGNCRRGMVCENQGERVQLGQKDERGDVDAKTKNKKVKRRK